jgi:hypothetical protein
MQPPAVASLHAKRYWMPDSQSKACTLCGAPFGFFRRKHHCRFCGKIFCHDCSRHEMDGRAFGDAGMVRVCDDCKRLEASVVSGGASTRVDGAADAARIESAVTMQQSGRRPAGGGSGAVDGGAPTGLAASEFVATTVGSGGGAAGGGGGGVGGGGDAEHRLGIGILDRRGRLSPPSGQAFNLPATPEAELLFRSLAAVAEEHLAWVIRRAVAAYIPEARHASSAQGAGAGSGTGGHPSSAAVAAAHAAKSGRAWQVLRAAAASPHTPASSVALGPRQSAWAETLTRLSRRAAATLDPNLRGGDRADVRMYLKVKAVPDPAPSAPAAPASAVGSGGGGASPSCRPPGQCELVSGFMFRRNLPHKGMRTDIAAPRVLLLDGEWRGGVACGPPCSVLRRDIPRDCPHPSHCPRPFPAGRPLGCRRAHL